MMKILLLISALLVTASFGQDLDVTPLARSLTLEEFTKIAATAVETDFEYTETAANKSNVYWDAAVDYEWSKNLAGENATGDKYPFILCNTAADVSGYQRRMMLAESYPSGGDLDNAKVIINSEDITCEIVHILPSEAAGIEGVDFAVQPQMASMKVIEGTLASFEEELDRINDGNNTDYVKIINVVLCPGVHIEADTNAAFNQEWKSNLTNRLVSNMYPSEIAEGYYFTSQAYYESELASSQNQTNRSLFWKDILDTFQKDETCNDVFLNRLIYSFSNFRTVPWVEVRYNATGVTKHDVGCILTLTLAISTLSTVCAVEISKSPQTLNVDAQWVMQTGKESSTPFFDVGLDGEGQIIAVSDTGIDTDNCYFWDNQHDKPNEKINLDNRKIVQYIPFENDSDIYHGHGTHVAGIIAGKRASDGEAESNGAADGAAPGAKLAFADLGDKLGWIYLPPYEELLATGHPYAQIHSMSWGVDINSYTTETKIFDDFMYENDEFLIVVAAGNIGEGNAYNTVGEPATGKNIIAVGSHHNGGNSSPKNSKGIGYASGFSSRGPTSDGRQKPDVLAPGHFILSAGALPRQVGECDPVLGTVEPGSSEEGLLSMEGTSMAAPALAGAAAIVRQYFNNGFYPSGERNDADIIENPSAALIKGVIMNGAQYVDGVQNEIIGITPVTPYDKTQNFGRISLKDSLYIAGKTDTRLSIFDREVIEDEETKTYRFVIDRSNGCTSSKFSVTLIWNEPGSIPGCMKCLLNDLDLTVLKDGAKYYPNGLSRPDRLNNNERIIIDNVRDGEELSATVNAKSLTNEKQKYSLIASGCLGGLGTADGFSESENFANSNVGVVNSNGGLSGVANSNGGSLHDKEAGVTLNSNDGSRLSIFIGLICISSHFIGLLVL